MLASLDRWMAANPWHPRIVPMFVYVAMLLPVQLLTGADDRLLWLYPPVYGLQCGVVAWLLWRYRRLTPELNLRFHWSAAPVGIIVLVVWLGLGHAMIQLAPDFFGSDGEPHYFERMQAVSPALFWSSLALRLAGMAVLVPLFEELFVRSLLLRSFHRPRQVGLGLLQILADMPLVGEWFEQTRLGQRVVHRGPVFGPEFLRTPLGALSVTGLVLSTAVFALHHTMRDWPGAIACGVAYCLLVGWTNAWGQSQGADQSGSAGRRGLGPVVWAHGITNALLWAWCVFRPDWQFV